MMTDPIADMLTRIRNGNRIEAPAVDMPATTVKQKIAQVLKDEGFIDNFQVGKASKNEAGQMVFQTDVDAKEAKRTLRIFLKYGPEGERVIRKIERASRPGLRLYKRCVELTPVLDGLGISIISTSRGIMSDRQARAQRLGGELLCTVW
jgi:small subunit ribosomal protein S8